MFSKEFYPTPKEVLDLMGIDPQGKVCYEPHAGKGDIVDYLIDGGASSVIATELNEDLRKIVGSKCQLLGTDFLKVQSCDIAHVQLIVMNPPFSNGDKHVEHAYEIAPEGCEIISLVNYETIAKEHRYSKLNRLILNNGTSQSLGSCFDNSERKTNVEIGLIKLYKPITKEGTDFSGFFMSDEEEEEIKGGDSIVKFDEVRALVQRYVGAMRVFDDIKKLVGTLEYTTSALGLKGYRIQVGYSDTGDVTTKEQFSKYLQKVSWNHIIDITGIRKFTTSLMMDDINKFVEVQHKVPFTMKNVYRMLDMIVQTRGQQFDRALISAVDEFTKYVKENRLGVEGWCANEGHMINRKIIIPNIFKRGWNNGNYVDVNWGCRYQQRLDDLMKVVCSLIGYDVREMNGYVVKNNKDGVSEKVYNRVGISSFEFEGSGHLETGKWYDWGFMEFKCFYKGTMHLRFKEKDHWYTLNKKYGELKGFTLPEKL